MGDFALEGGKCILKLLWETVKRLKDLPDDVRDIRDELEELKINIKADGENVATKLNKKKQDLMQLRKATFLTEDVIDEYLILIEEKQPQDDRGWAAFPSKAAYHIQTLIPRILISYKIENMLSVVRTRNEVFQKEDRSQSTQNNENIIYHQREIHPFFMDEDEVVGLAGPTQILTDWLTQGQEDRTVISIVGKAGVGKTTLAKHVFDKVHHDFECHAWITVSQSCNVEKLLKAMLCKLCNESTKNLPTDAVTLIEKVRNYLRGKRYVLLFDDVWDGEFWDKIRTALIENKNKSRIIVTTRIENVARDSTFFKEYKLEEPLTEEECLRLLHKKARNSFDCPEKLKNISLKIVRKCRALPLAIAVAGGVLSRKDGSADEWGLFSEELKRNPDLNIITKIIGLSYDYLPNDLRLCLLYFGMYPEHYEIESERLFRQWVAEGFVTQKEGRTLEEVAHEYLLGLVRRSLVQVSSVSMNGKVKKCRVHDSIHDMILTKVKDTCFGKYIGGGHDQSESSESVRRSESSELVRRLTIETNTDLNRPIKRSLIRSIIVIPGKQKSWFVDFESKILKNDMPLKVLDFEDCGLLCVPEKLGNLIYLRYLSFRGTQIRVLPKSIGKLVNLETLDIRKTEVREVPKEITKLRKLRHLLTPDSVSSSIEWKDIGGMTMLQKIPQVRMEDDEVAIREVGKLKQLRVLRVLCFSGEHITLLFSSINEMIHLQALRIERSEETIVVNLNTEAMSPDQSKLRKLFIAMKLKKLPNWIPQLKNLERLTLRLSELPNDPLESLKDMPSLLVLSLSNAYKGKTLHFQSKGFKKLRNLNLEHLWKLNSILIDETALQSLKHLMLKGLDELRTVPDGIQHLEKLESLLVHCMPTQFVEKIDRIGKDQHWNINYGYM